MDFFGNRRVPDPKPGTPNPYSAGKKHYGGGRSMPNIGPVSGPGMLGYSQRDLKAQARKDAIKRRLKGQQSGNPMNKNVMNYPGVI